MSLRILMVTSEWPTEDLPFGASYLVRQVDFLKRSGLSVDVFSFRGNKRPLNYLKAWWSLRNRLRDKSYDLLHAQFGQSGLLAFPRRLPLVVTFHGCDIQGVRCADGAISIAGRLLQLLCHAVAVRAEGVVIVSERMRRYLPASLDAAVIPTGLDFAAMALVPKHKARRELGLNPSERLVLFVGKPDEAVKRYWLAEQSVEVLSQRLPARLIVGWGMPQQRIFLLMNACDALVITSIQEGSPNIVKEALAFNLPVVSLDIGDVPQRLEGIEGCEICPDELPETIAAALERVLRRGRRIRGRETVSSLDEGLLTDRLINVYQTVLSANSKKLPTRTIAQSTEEA
jgi:teichuronic acid biosynthesis glycosyltransferase TuaC